MAYHVPMLMERQRRQEKASRGPTSRFDSTVEESEEKGNESTESFARMTWTKHTNHSVDFWKEIHTHHQANYKVSAGSGMSISQLVADTKTKARMEEFELQKKLKSKLYIGGKYKFVINPRHQYKIRWDMFIGLVILYTAIWTPMQVGFGIEVGVLSFFGILNIFVDLLFVVDLVVSFRTAYQDENDALLVVQPNKISMHYLKTWFLIDFVSTFPIDHIVILTSSDGDDGGTRVSKLVRTLRLFRLMKLVRLLKLQKLREAIRDLDINPGIMSLANLMMYIIFIAHLLACFWNLCSVSNTGGSTWSDSLDTYAAPKYDILDQYIWAQYWTVATMMGVGYGDVSAVTTNERIYSILAQTVGAFTFGWILATMTIFYESSDPRTARIDAHVQELKSYMREKKIPKSLQQQVLKNLHYRYEVKSIFGESEILNELSDHLADEVAINAYKKIINIFPILQRSKGRLVRLLCVAMKPSYIEENDILYYQNRSSPGLFFVKSGMVIFTRIKEYNEAEGVVDDQEGQLLAMYTAGGHFGHECDKGEYKSQCFVRAAVNCDILTVSAEDLEMIDEFPGLLKYLRKDGDALREKLEEVIALQENPEPKKGKRSVKIITNGKIKTKIKRRSLSIARMKSSKHIYASESEIKEKADTDVDLVHCIFNAKYKSQLPTNQEGEYCDYGSDEDEDEGDEKDQDQVPAHLNTINRLKRRFSVVEHLPSTMIEANVSKAFLHQLGFIHPNGKYKQRWDGFIGLLIVYSVINIPLALSFDLEPQEGDHFGIFWEWMIDFLFLLDIFVSSRTVYTDPEKRAFVADHKLIQKHYLKTWFTIDFLSTIPIDKIAGAIARISASNDDAANSLRLVKLIRGLRLIRLLKLARVLKLGKIQDSIEEIFDSPNTFKLAKLGLMLVVYAHFIGCIWFTASGGRGTAMEFKANSTWWGAMGLHDEEKYGVGDLYIASLYWAFTTMTTVGYGDILPVTRDERIVAILVMIIGATLFGYVIGNVAATTMSHDIAKARKEDRLLEVSSYLREKHVSRSVRKKVEEFFHYLYETRSAFDEQEILSELPKSTRDKILIHLHSDDALKFKNSIFKLLNRQEACLLLSFMKPQVYSANDIVYETGDPGNALYLVQEGSIIELKEEDDDDNPYRTYREGYYFGEKALMLNILRLSTTKSKTLSTVLILSKNIIGRMVDSSHEVENALEKVMRNTVKLTLSKEQMARATENSDFHREHKVYSMLLNKARNIRKRKSGRKGTLLRTQSAFEAVPKRNKSSTEDDQTANTFLDGVADSVVSDLGEELERVDADSGGGF